MIDRLDFLIADRWAALSVDFSPGNLALLADALRVLDYARTLEGQAEAPEGEGLPDAVGNLPVG